MFERIVYNMVDFDEQDIIYWAILDRDLVPVCEYCGKIEWDIPKPGVNWAKHEMETYKRDVLEEISMTTLRDLLIGIAGDFNGDADWFINNKDIKSNE